MESSFGNFHDAGLFCIFPLTARDIMRNFGGSLWSISPGKDSPQKRPERTFPTPIMALRFSKRELPPHGRRFFSGLVNDKKSRDTGGDGQKWNGCAPFSKRNSVTLPSVSGATTWEKTGPDSRHCRLPRPDGLVILICPAPMKALSLHRFILLSLSVLPFSLPAQTVLVQDGKAVAHIVCADKDSTTRRAATLLQDFTQRATGARLQIAEKGRARRGDIVIGGPTSRAGEDGFEMRTADDGTLYLRSGGGKGAI